jgi:hypothetical protein
MAAILAVESNNGKDTRVGDNGRAVGLYQMQPVAVREVNRIYKTAYTLEDRKDFAKATKMCELTLLYHYKRGVTDPVKLACKWRNPYSSAPLWHKRKIQKEIKEHGTKRI